MESLSNLLRRFSGISVMALVGESGTGKSFKSKLLAQKYGIDAIIDDGLLIQNDKILGGRSAKTEKTYMGAVRVALFDDKEHRDEIARILKKSHIKKILLLGTSEKMVVKIATRLQLPPPSKIIKIEDIATREEIDKAIRSRQIEGKHVIPVPAIEIKRNYSQIFYDSIKVFFSKPAMLFSRKKGAAGKTFEKSVVTPEFSKKGRVSISEAALTQMTMHCVQEFDPNIRVKKFSIRTNARGYRLVITIDVPFGKQLTGEIYKLQQYIVDNIEKYTGILIEEVSIVIDKISGTDKIKKY
ncbi:hypothetical protein [Treponema sp.]|uniref:hypothetical protein n=1 Tax=Treponema sp. TaxID=166 RepID=UPI00298E0F89|nr:hypothetical protein [Treponema sp.]MCR5613270.1 hypothetical protein [Treponema sp.]